MYRERSSEPLLLITKQRAGSVRELVSRLAVYWRQMTGRESMRHFTKAAVVAAGIGCIAGTATAQTTTLRIQTHYGPEQTSGQLAADFWQFARSSKLSKCLVPCEPPP